MDERLKFAHALLVSELGHLAVEFREVGWLDAAGYVEGYRDQVATCDGEDCELRRTVEAL